MALPRASAGPTAWRRCAGAARVGLLVAALAAGPGCGSAPESAPSSDSPFGLSGDETAMFRSGEPIGGPERSPAEATAVFMDFDANDDGLLDATELPSQLQSLIARADADGDGMASEEEILALITRETAESAEAAEADETP